MAEELDIRSVWKKSKEKSDSSAFQIDHLERKGTRTTLYWIKTILWIEFWLSIAALPFIIYYSFNRGDSIGLMLGYTAITILYLFYYQFLIRAIRHFSYDRNVLQSLKKVYGYLRFYLLHYKVMFWISMVIGFIYGLTDPKNADDMANIQTNTQWLAVIAVWVVLFAIIGGIFHLLLHLIYGRKIKRLKRMVKDLQKEE